MEENSWKGQLTMAVYFNCFNLNKLSLIFKECILLYINTIYEFHFSCQTQQYTK
jgi:hypothetical protein